MSLMRKKKEKIGKKWILLKAYAHIYIYIWERLYVYIICSELIGLKKY